MRARNCQPVSVVTSEEMQMTPAMALRYLEEKTSCMLAKRFRGPVSADSWVIPCAPPTATCPLRQMKPIKAVQINRNNAMPSSRLSVPKVLVMVLEKKPAKIQPAMAPPPTIPKTRLASRVVRT